MEAELQKVYQMAGELGDVEPTAPNVMPALAAPSPVSFTNAAPAQLAHNTLSATDVRIKSKPRKLSAKSRNQRAAAKAKTVSGSGIRSSSVKIKTTPLAPLPSNAAQLLKHLGALLNSHEFAAVNQTAVSKATGFPLGSMSAALRRLMDDGLLLKNSTGQYKLA